MAIAVLITLLALLTSCVGREESSTERMPFVVKIVFSSNRGESDDIYILNTENGELTQLTHNAGRNIWPMWSRNGDYITFFSNRDGDWDIYVTSASGYNPKNLSHDDYDSLMPFSWSPDSTRLAFSSSYDGLSPEIYIAYVENGELVRLTNNTIYDSNPVWSPDGNHIAYTFSKPEGRGLAIVELRTGQTAHILENEPWISEPVWSPDGNWIAFEAARQDGTVRIDVIKVDGSQRYESICGDLLAGDPAWSHKGDWIAFVGHSRENGSSQLYIVRMDGSDLVTLVGDGVINPPVWSLDDNWIIFTGVSSKLDRRPGDLDIYAVEVDGEGFVNLTHSQGDDEAPDWLLGD